MFLIPENADNPLDGQHNTNVKGLRTIQKKIIRTMLSANGTYVKQLTAFFRWIDFNITTKANQGTGTGVYNEITNLQFFSSQWMNEGMNFKWKLYALLRYNTYNIKTKTWSASRFASLTHRKNN